VQVNLALQTPFNAPRFFKNNGELVITREEAEAQARRAETERADAAETEIARLKALLSKKSDF
jgi:hypothetical protein